MIASRAATLLLALAAVGCGAPEPAGGTGGVTLPEGLCGRGVAVSSTDYQSTNLSLLTPEGAVASASFFSSATSGVGLTAPLSGDVALPTVRAAGDALMVIDRRPAAVITWVDLATAAATRQLSVATGFLSNPQDYLPLDEREAYVSRYDRNFDPGREPLDEGSDVLRIDPSTGTLVERIDLDLALAPSERGLYLPRPGRMARLQGVVVVVLGAYRPDFSGAAPGRLAVIDPARHRLVSSVSLGGLHGCVGLDASPAGDAVAVTCSGRFTGPTTPEAATSGLAIVRLDGDGAPALDAVLTAESLGGDPLGFGVAFASDHTVLVTTLGVVEPRVPDRLLAVDLAGATARIVAEAPGRPLELGEVRCLPACGRCFLADSMAGLVRTYRVDAGDIVPESEIVPDPLHRLPPRGLGLF